MNRKGGLPAVHTRSETAIASHGGWWPPLHLERMVRPLKWRPMIDATDAEPGVRAGDARMDQEIKGSSYGFFGINHGGELRTRGPGGDASLFLWGIRHREHDMVHDAATILNWNKKAGTLSDAGLIIFC